MSFIKVVALSSLVLLGITSSVAITRRVERVLACNLDALTPEQRMSHRASTARLLAEAKREELADGYSFTFDPDRVSVAELAEWVANESKCCPSLDFHLRLPAFGQRVLRIDGGADVKAFLAAELSL